MVESQKNGLFSNGGFGEFSPFSVNVSVNENENISMENSKNAILHSYLYGPNGQCRFSVPFSYPNHHPKSLTAEKGRESERGQR